MKKQILRTSAIALGVAAALPATAQEWNLGWGGFMNQHVVFGSTEIEKSGANLAGASTVIEIDADGREEADTKTAKAKIKVKFISERPSDDDITAASNQVLVSADGSSVDFTTSTVTEYYLPDGITLLGSGPNATDEDNPNNSLAGWVRLLDSATNNTAGIGTRTNVDDITLFVTVPATSETAGFARTAVAEVNKSIDMSGNGQRRNSEVHFKPSVTLENGLTFAAAIELEGDAGGVDRSNITISSDSLGKIILGAHSSMGYGMMVAAPSVGLGINDGAHHNFIPVSKGPGASNGTFLEVADKWEPMRVSYQSPSLGGLTLGLSYAADGKRVGGNSANHTGFLKEAEEKGDVSDIIDMAAKFSQPLGDMTITLAARYGTAQLEGYSDKPRVTAVGAQLGFGGVTIGGGFADAKNPAGMDSEGWSLGASFKPTEAWTLGIETYQGESENGNDHSVAKIAASRNLGPGVA
ncbi:MAG: porin, partial [Aestuariivita sp.]|nr:porin [Aestuariivita sp.]